MTKSISAIIRSLQGGTNKNFSRPFNNFLPILTIHCHKRRVIRSMVTFHFDEHFFTGTYQVNVSKTSTDALGAHRQNCPENGPSISPCPTASPKEEQWNSAENWPSWPSLAHHVPSFLFWLSLQARLCKCNYNKKRGFLYDLFAVYVAFHFKFVKLVLEEVSVPPTILLLLLPALQLFFITKLKQLSTPALLCLSTRHF